MTDPVYIHITPKAMEMVKGWVLSGVDAHAYTTGEGKQFYIEVYEHAKANNMIPDGMTRMVALFLIAAVHRAKLADFAEDARWN